MKTEPSYPGKYYVVTSPNGCTVTAKNGKQLGTVEAGQQGGFTAIDSAIEASDEEAEITQVFKLAPQQKLAIIGVLGGNDGLPAGYTRLAYLESSGTQFIAIRDIKIDNDLGALCDYVDFNSVNDAPMFSGTRYVNGTPRFYLPYTSKGTGYYGWNDWVELGVYNNTNQRTVSLLNYFNDRKYKMSYADTVLSGTLNNFLPVVNNQFLSLFCYNPTVNQPRYVTGRCYSAQLTSAAEMVCNFIPALDPTGTPGMYDTVTRKPFRNNGSGQFIAGVETQPQLDAVLRGLPDRTGQDVGTLTVRLADDLQTEENRVAMDAMVSKNWEITEAA